MDASHPPFRAPARPMSFCWIEGGWPAAEWRQGLSESVSMRLARAEWRGPAATEPSGLDSPADLRVNQPRRDHRRGACGLMDPQHGFTVADRSGPLLPLRRPEPACAANFAALQQRGFDFHAATATYSARAENQVRRRTQIARPQDLRLRSGEADRLLQAEWTATSSSPALKLPGFDAEAVVGAQKKNMEAPVEANGCRRWLLDLVREAASRSERRP